ncbi:Beta-1,3-galactosyltransferase brn [Pseudolycoriella hygida]|uniref:Hexosyltransferase n=1 Tax=Pseudolycoriella hygida TaxID=35572 RepID=A0A9Q0MK49_9DIPT|nr:Beta-1,3-galactosyltransferase brn [Pseudolycoriella hygida]
MLPIRNCVRWCLRFRVKYVAGVCLGLFILDYFGAFTHYFEADFYKEFNYPLNGDVLKYANQVRQGKSPDIDPINLYNYSFKYNCKQKCWNDDDERFLVPKLVFIVKSAMRNVNKRIAIRHSWGFERRFSDILIRTVFVLGQTAEQDEELQAQIDEEQQKFKDIVQVDFVDTYFNNTIKTMMGMKWVVTYCPKSKFYMFVDDDYYVSAKNVLRFVRNPVNFPEYLEEADETLRKLARRLSNSDMLNNSVVNVHEMKNIVQNVNSVNNKDLVKTIQKFINAEEQRPKNARKLMQMQLADDVKLFSGFVFNSAPHRHKCSKWHVSLKEYAWHMWPPYVTAGAFILSREALHRMYYVSMYTKHFRFDDIYLAIVALKADIEPLHSEEFYFYKAPYQGPHNYRYVIATHGYDDPLDILKTWNECRSAGHA